MSQNVSLLTNREDLVVVSVAGAVAHPGFPGLPAEPYRLAADGTPFLLPTYGGIVYNVSVGDRAFGWAADCIHPSVSIRQRDDNGNRGLNVLSCGPWSGAGRPAMPRSEASAAIGAAPASGARNTNLRQISRVISGETMASMSAPMQAESSGPVARGMRVGAHRGQRRAFP